MNRRLLYVLAGGYFIISALRVFKVIDPVQATELIASGAIALHLLQLPLPKVADLPVLPAPLTPPQTAKTI